MQKTGSRIEMLTLAIPLSNRKITLLSQSVMAENCQLDSDAIQEGNTASGIQETFSLVCLFLASSPLFCCKKLKAYGIDIKSS
jgi:hypothetical protein